MPQLIITMSDRHDPKEPLGWHDGSRAGFSTDRRRAKPFPTRREARMALADLRRRFPHQAMGLISSHRANPAAARGDGNGDGAMGMTKSLVVWITTALFALGGCVIGAETAQHDMEASKAAFKACLAARGPEACEGQRQAYETDLSAYRATPKLVIGVGDPPPLPASDGMGTGLGGSMEGGQTVYSPNECIGAVVMGQCHGSILPDYGRAHPTCYGKMINGICTGPMF